MPKAYEAMKSAMQKEYGMKKGEKIAAMTWNKHMKGTGNTVGRGREPMMTDKEASEMMKDKEGKSDKD